MQIDHFIWIPLALFSLAEDSAVLNTDYLVLKKKYEESWNIIKDQNHLKILGKTLKNVGVKFEVDEIDLDDASRWFEVSMHIGLNSIMPSCTNQLENSYGHFNSMTLRKNQLWPSLSRIIKEF